MPDTSLRTAVRAVAVKQETGTNRIPERADRAQDRLGGGDAAAGSPFGTLPATTPAPGLAVTPAPSSAPVETPMEMQQAPPQPLQVLPEETSPLGEAPGETQEASPPQSSATWPVMSAEPAAETPGTIWPWEGPPAWRAMGLVLGVALVLMLALLGTLLAAKLLRRRRFKTSKPNRLEVPTGPAQRGWSVSAGNAQGIGRRANQEDSFGVSDVYDASQLSERGILAVVADGMGGLEKGEEISAAATQSMLREFPQAPPALSPSQLLLYLVHQANREALQLAERINGRCGSTLIAALIKDNRLYYASVGDSRIYLYRDGTLLLLTRPHVYAAELDERAARGDISLEEAASHAKRKAVTSFIGMRRLEKVDYNVEPVFLSRGDRVLLMSDGIFGSLADAEIAAAVQTDAQATAETLEWAVRAKNNAYQDNYTVVVLQLN